MNQKIHEQEEDASFSASRLQENTMTALEKKHSMEKIKIPEILIYGNMQNMSQCYV